MTFRPPHCPQDGCPARDNRALFRWRRAGRYRRKCDGLVVPRFLCRNCGTRFSRQTFRFNYRWWKPEVHLQLFWEFIGKSSMRQSARRFGVSRDTVARRLRAMGEHCRKWHQLRLRHAAGTLEPRFVFDELETFETDRRVRPVTVPVLIQNSTLFVVHAETAPLPPRGRLDPVRQQRKERDERLYGKRRSGSRAACERTLKKIAWLMDPEEYLDLVTDRKSSYRRLRREHLNERFASHVMEYSKSARNRSNPLFPINHTLAMMRDGLSRLVRRSWCHAKKREWLEYQIWVWIVYRNYIREITNKDKRNTPAMAAGVYWWRLRAQDVFRWRWTERMEAA